jgi:hypothetical protein
VATKILFLTGRGDGRRHESCSTDIAEALEKLSKLSKVPDVASELVAE